VNALELRGLAVDVGAKRLIGPLDLDVREGEHVLVAGRSGSGKTTLLRAIAGLAVPSAGQVRLFGELASDGRKLALPPERRRIGFLFQGGALWPHMSVARQIAFVLKCSPSRNGSVDSRVRELLDWVELPGYEKRMPATLSGGEAQRLALARALAVEPRLLLLDEPLGPLDAELRGALLGKLGELQKRLNLTVLHVTHAPEEARAIATRVVRMSAGQLAEASA
jgi:ABC-type sulfate/molybdate transport systems ATPase subunit